MAKVKIAVVKDRETEYQKGKIIETQTVEVTEFESEKAAEAWLEDHRSGSLQYWKLYEGSEGYDKVS